MILSKTNNIEDLTYESYNLEEKKFETTIDKSDSYLIMNLVSSFYRNPIGSIIREITSNCFDAHTKANNKEDAVVIAVKYDHENSNYYIEFIDKGTGLSEKQIEDIYSTWFKSDKRDSNDFIGGFGLGSKSPFSYQDIFYITTVVDNVKYEYVYFKKEANSQGVREFELSQINKINTIESNGTTIKLELLDNDDLNKFVYEIRNQLSYFYNVFLDLKDCMFIDNYRYNIRYFNEEKIIEYKTFSYRCSKVNSNYSFTEDKNIFILLGSVKYEININEMPDLKCNLPLGIKFEIGDLTVVPNREDILYSIENKKKIREKFEEFKKEIYELLCKQNTLDFDDYTEYKRNVDLKLVLGNEEYNKTIFSNTFKDIEIFKNIKKTFTPLKDYNYNKIDISILSVFYDFIPNYYINGEVYLLSHSLTSVLNYFYSSKTFIHKLQKTTRKQKIVEAFKEYIGYYFKKKIRKNTIQCEIREEAGLDNFLTDCLHDYNEYTVVLHNGNTVNTKSRIVPELGKALKLYQMIKYFKSIVSIKKAEELEITEQMQIQYKEYLDSKNIALMRKKNKEFLVYEYSTRHEFFNKTTVKISQLEKYLFCIYKIKNTDKYANKYIYVNNKRILLEDIHKLMKLVHESFNLNKKYIKNRFIFFEISNSELIKLKKEELTNLISIEDFLFTDFVKKNIYKSTIREQFINNNYIQSSSLYDKLIFNISNYYKTQYQIIKDEIYKLPALYELHKLYNINKLKDEFPNLLLSKNILFYQKILNEINIIHKKNPVIDYLNNHTPIKIALKVLKGIKFLNYPESPYVKIIKQNKIKEINNNIIYLV